MKILKFLIVLVAVLSITLGAPATVLALGQPGASYPTNGELIYSYGASQIEFQWSSSGTMGTVYYDVQVSTDPTFTNSAAIVSNNFMIPNHSNCHNYPNQPTNWTSSFAYSSQTTYYWRIQAYDTTCTGDFSTGGSGWALYSFKTAISAPTLVNPTSGTLVDNLHDDQLLTSGHPYPLFRWAAVTGASGYILQVSTVATFSSLYVNTTVSSSATYDGGVDIGYSPTSDITAGTTFYWRVETLNSTYGPSAWSNTPAACVSGYCTFTSANVSAAPVPLSIAQTNVYKTPTGKVTTDFTPGLRWQEATLPSGATFTTYQVQASMDSTFKDSTQNCFTVDNSTMAILANQVYNNDYTDYNYAQLDTQTALAVSSSGVNCLVSGGKFESTNQYYWRVRAVFGGPAYSDWSTVFSFKTSYLKPISLSTSTDTTKHTVTFTWSYPSGTAQKPYGYHINVCFDANLSEGQCVLSKTNVSPGLVFGVAANPHNIPPGETMWWSVSATGPWGPGLWSTPVSFVTP